MLVLNTDSAFQYSNLRGRNRLCVSHEDFQEFQGGCILYTQIYVPVRHRAAKTNASTNVSPRAQGLILERQKRTQFVFCVSLSLGSLGWQPKLDSLHVWPRFDLLALPAVSTIHVVDLLHHVDAALLAAEAVEFVHPWMRLEAATCIQTTCQKAIQDHGI